MEKSYIFVWGRDIDLFQMNDYILFSAVLEYRITNWGTLKVEAVL